MISAAIVLTVLFVATWWLIYHLLIQYGRLQLRLEQMERRFRDQGFVPPSGPAESSPVKDGLPRGTLLTDFELPVIGGGTTRLSSWLNRKVLLIFFNPGCGHCLRLIPALQAIEEARLHQEPVPFIITTGDAEENRRLFEGFNIASRVALQEGAEVSTLFRVTGTPSGYFIGRDGRTASNLLMGAPALALALSVRHEAQWI